MVSLFTVLPLLLATAAPFAGGRDGPIAVTADGGEVPVVIPNLTPAVAPLLAPELIPDGGEPVVTRPSLSVYNVDLPTEGAITAASFGLYFMVDVLIKPSLQGGSSCRTETGSGGCNPADLSTFDRYAVGKSSRGWAAFSDVVLASSMVVPILYLALESFALPTQEPWGDFAKDALVVTESLALSAGLTTLLKFSFRRPRPGRYLDTPTSTFDSELSAPSGHVTLVAAGTTALTTTIFLRHPDSKLRYLALGTGILLSALTGLARVEAGSHFPTDAILGVFVGGFAGFVTPYLHRKDSKFRPAVSFNPETGATMFSVAGPLR